MEARCKSASGQITDRRFVSRHRPEDGYAPAFTAAAPSAAAPRRILNRSTMRTRGSSPPVHTLLPALGDSERVRCSDGLFQFMSIVDQGACLREYGATVR
jgi:hypothetical protein